MGDVSYIHLRKGQRARHKLVNKTVGNARPWLKVWMIFGFVGGIIAAISGTIFTSITWLAGASAGSARWLHGIGTVLLLVTIPLLMFGAHCLDLAEAEEKRRSETEGRDEPAKLNKPFQG